MMTRAPAFPDPVLKGGNSIPALLGNFWRAPRFRAEALFKKALVAKCEDLSRCPSIARRDTRTEPGILAEFALEGGHGHWEVWESEWVVAQWVWDHPPGKAA
jgi:hypothetical protein